MASRAISLTLVTLGKTLQAPCLIPDLTGSKGGGCLSHPHVIHVVGDCAQRCSGVCWQRLLGATARVAKGASAVFKRERRPVFEALWHAFHQLTNMLQKRAQIRFSSTLTVQETCQLDTHPWSYCPAVVTRSTI